MDLLEDGRFLHKCTLVMCLVQVEYDDEPWCFTHSPDSGSAIAGYSAREVALGNQRRPGCWLCGFHQVVIYRGEVRHHQGMCGACFAEWFERGGVVEEDLPTE